MKAFAGYEARIAHLGCGTATLRFAAAAFSVCIVACSAQRAPTASPAARSASAARSAPPRANVGSRPLLERYGIAPDYRFRQAEPDCPIQVPQTTLATIPIEGGTALAFSTPSAREEVRARAARLADDYEKETVPGIPPLHAKEVDTPDGARIEIRAVWLKDAERVREVLRERVQKIRASDSCPSLRAAAR